MCQILLISIFFYAKSIHFEFIFGKKSRVASFIRFAFFHLEKDSVVINSLGARRLLLKRRISFKIIMGVCGSRRLTRAWPANALVFDLH